MKTFIDIWQLLSPKAEYVKYDFLTKFSLSEEH